MANATPEDVSRLAGAVAEFRDLYAEFSSPAYGTRIARMNDPELMRDYERTLGRLDTVMNAIDQIGGLWENAKSWAGASLDTIKLWFGFSGLGGLGVIPLIPIAVVAGVTAAVLGGISLIKEFMRRADVSAIQNENPGMSRDEAMALYERHSQGDFGKLADLGKYAILLGGAWLVYKVFRDW
jgi:hypothetical protein